MICAKHLIFKKTWVFVSLLFLACFLPLASSAYSAESGAEIPVEILGEDGAPMMLVPAGDFLMGTPEKTRGYGIRDNSKPQRKIYLDAFYMDKYEVSNALYRKYVEANGGGTVAPAYLPTNRRMLDPSRHDNIPVTSIMWQSAKGYCEWVGKRLPTEAEWEKGARGTDGLDYPWGSEEPKKEHANWGVPPQHWRGPNSLAPVDSYPKGVSPYGLHHMAGNVFEWVNDIYFEEYYKDTNGIVVRSQVNPQGPERGTKNRHGKEFDSYSVRGGSAKSQPPVLRSAFRAGWSHIYVPPHGGFRCAKSVGPDVIADAYDGGGQ